jgi:plastocyanin
MRLSGSASASFVGLVGLVLGAALLGGGACGSSSNNNGPGGSGGSGGTGGGGSGGTGGTGGSTADAGPTFMAIKPCDSADAYTPGNTIMFGTGGSLTYSPKCLKVAKGGTVTFKGDFTLHPLSASKNRGNTTDNPIKTTMSGMSEPFTFSTPGYYAYYCQYHGPSDDGTGMAGVIWVTP